MQKECFIVVDQGSSSSRAVAFSSSGEVLGKVSKPLLASFPKPGWAEYDAGVLLDSQLSALNELLSGLEARPLSIGITAQRSTFVVWDRSTGKPFCPALSWQDGRAVSELAGVQYSNTDIHNITGLYKTPYFSGPKIKWCLNNHPDAARAGEDGRLMIGPVSSFLLWHMTGGSSFMVDPTFAQRMLIFDIHRLEWERNLLETFGLKESFLPELRPSVGAFGKFRHNGLEIPIEVMIGDQQSAAAGVGAWKNRTAAANYGTGAFFLANTGSRPVNIPGLLTSIGWQHENGGVTFLSEGAVNSAASMLDWLTAIGIPFSKEEVDVMCRASSDPVDVIPALGGLGSPFFDFNVKTTMTNFSPRTKPADIVRGTVEGIAYLMSDICGAMLKSGVPVDGVFASGGLAKSDFLLQYQSDMLQMPVVRTPETETTALGTAYFLAKKAGLSPENNWNVFTEGTAFQPDIRFNAAEKKLRRWALLRDSVRHLASDLASFS